MSSSHWATAVLGELADDWKQSWKPAESTHEFVDHYSIPAFDNGRRPSRDRPSDIKSNKRVVAPDSVLVSRLNPVTPRIWAPTLDSSTESVCSGEMLVLRPKPGVDRGYLEYLCKSPYVSRAMLQRVSGTTGSHQRVSPRDVLALSVPLPPLDEQRAIAEVLGSIDDRLEWCEGLASQLLKLTRVHYRLRCEANSTSVSIVDCAAVYFGAPYDSAQFNTKQVGKPLIRIRDIDALDASVYTTQTHRAEVQIAPGDIVVGMDGEFRAHFWRGPLAVLNQRVCTFRPVDPNRTVDLLHALEEPLKLSEASISGTTVSHLGKRHIDDFVLTMPSESSGALMEATAHIALLGSEIRMLTEMRQSLLLPLVSGDVRIENPERLIGQIQ